MRIFGIQNFNTYTPQTSTKKQVKFTGYISGFSQCLDEVLTKKYCSASDSFYMHDELNKILTKRLKNNEILGEGTLAKVLKIDSKYAMRIAKGYKSVVDGFDRTFKPFHEGLDFKTYYGGYVAKFGDVQILKNVSATGEHIPGGVPSKLTYNATPGECLKYYEQEYLPKFANLPQKSFDDVAHDFNVLNSCYDGEWYSFDVLNPNNFVLVGNKIKIVDNIVNTGRNPYYLGAYSDDFIDKSMTTTDMMRVFLMMQDYSTECEFSENMLPLRRQLFKKIVIAGVKNNLKTCNDENIYCFEKVAETLCKAKYDSNIVKIKLDKFVEDYPKDPQGTIKEVSKYIDNLFGALSDSPNFNSLRILLFRQQ